MLMTEPQQACGPETIAVSALGGFAVESHQPFFLQLILSKSTYYVQGTTGQEAVYKAILPGSLGEETEYSYTRSPVPYLA